MCIYTFLYRPLPARQPPAGGPEEGQPQQVYNIHT